MTSELIFGVLGAALLVKRRAVGLGKALMLIAALVSLDYLLAGLADAIAGGQAPPPTVAQVFNSASEACFIVAFFLLVLAPTLLFPTGRLPSPRWAWVGWAAVTGCALSVVSVLLAPGLVDEDVPAWGNNPIGLDSLPKVVDGLEVAGAVLLMGSILAGLAAFVTRWIRYRGARRRQMAWLTTGVAVQVVGLATDTSGESVAVEVLMALVIFGALLFGMGWPLLGPLGRIADEAEQDNGSAVFTPDPATRAHPLPG